MMFLETFIDFDSFCLSLSVKVDIFMYDNSLYLIIIYLNGLFEGLLSPNNCSR